jgi:hypothetical protein
MPSEESSSHSQGQDEVVDRHESAVVEPSAGVPVHADETVVRGASPLVVWTNVIYLVFAVICGLIAIRFVLKLLGANPQAGFASFINGATDPLMGPFNGLLGTPSVASGSSFEVSALVAILVYALIGWVLTQLARIILNRSVSRSHTEVH